MINKGYKNSNSYGHQNQNPDVDNSRPHEGPVERDKEHHSIVRVVDMKDIHNQQHANMRAVSKPAPNAAPSKLADKVKRADPKFSGDKYRQYDRQHHAPKPGMIDSLVGPSKK